ncbi:hypothetical protein [Legionella sp. 16cNR16C]|uniref:hypothetical protein n=1 Tax=Legionella sp. 16cNR16C TaxID=2905656 RepID=UPI001E4A4B2D|nr:hypothetical protein [Legionella sp. 16cNR16C]MCE3045633.1 hypothetical protein [Legionella sp. 16cNR16C]
MKFLIDWLSIVFIYLTPKSYKSINILADKELSNLKKKNSSFQNYRYKWIYRAINYFNTRIYLMLISLVFLLLVPITLVNNAFTDIYVPYWGRFDLSNYILSHSKVSTNNLHSIMATIQATVFALIIPIAVAIHEFVLKDNKLKEEMINFILEETKVKLITVSSLSFLIWLAIIEVINVVSQGFVVSNISLIIETFWLTLNLILIAYFTFTTLNLVNRSFFDNALRQFIATKIYPNELKIYLKRNIYLNLANNENHND